MKTIGCWPTSGFNASPTVRCSQLCYSRHSSAPSTAAPSPGKSSKEPRRFRMGEIDQRERFQEQQQNTNTDHTEAARMNTDLGKAGLSRAFHNVVIPTLCRGGPKDLRGIVKRELDQRERFEELYQNTSTAHMEAARMNRSC